VTISMRSYDHGWNPELSRKVSFKFLSSLTYFQIEVAPSSISSALLLQSFLPNQNMGGDIIQEP